jgi:hypothetical protein
MSLISVALGECCCYFDLYKEPRSMRRVSESSHLVKHSV